MSLPVGPFWLPSAIPPVPVPHPAPQTLRSVEKLSDAELASNLAYWEQTLQQAQQQIFQLKLEQNFREAQVLCSEAHLWEGIPSMEETEDDLTEILETGYGCVWGEAEKMSLGMDGS